MSGQINDLVPLIRKHYHRSESGRATFVPSASAQGRPLRSILAFA
jgi:hypothetical protein